MITNLRQITSLNNLGKQGQVATLLILTMVAVLVFILVTVNIGQVSITATNLSNAADSAALYLGSQLSTRARMFAENLGSSDNPRTEKFWDTGCLDIVLAAVLAFLCVITAQPQGLLAAVKIGAAAGTVGGAAGGGMSGTGVISGAIKGFQIGASIGYGYGAGAGMSGPGGAEATAVYEAPGVIAPENVALGAFESLPKGSMLTSGIGSTLAIPNAAKTTAASIYNAYVGGRIAAKDIAVLADALSGLPQYDRYREGVFLYALTQTVDDPDVDRFKDFCRVRIDGLLDDTASLEDIVRKYLTGSFSNFANNAEIFINADLNLVDSTSDGYIVELLRAMTDSGYTGFTFWGPGRRGAEELEYVSEKLENFVSEVNSFYNVTTGVHDFYDELDHIDQMYYDQEPAYFREIANRWLSWIGCFYEPDNINPETGTVIEENRGDFYDVMETLVNGDSDIQGLKKWKEQIEEVRNNLPEAEHPLIDEGEDNTRVLNPPCKDTLETGEIISTIDESLTDVDEFENVIIRIGNFIRDIEAFHDGPGNPEYLYNDLTQITRPGVDNIITYRWADSRGAHEVIVEVGPFNVSRFGEEERAKDKFIPKELIGEKGLVLKDFYDVTGENTWVRITRKDPANKKVGILGKWNPVASADEKFFTITRESHVSYNHKYIRMIGK